MKYIVERPLITEKTSTMIEANKFTFLVNSDVNKIEIAKYVSQTYDVVVESVNILMKKSKKRKRGRIQGSTKERKKAIVTISAKSDSEKIRKVF